MRTIWLCVVCVCVAARAYALEGWQPIPAEAFRGGDIGATCTRTEVAAGIGTVTTWACSQGEQIWVPWWFPTNTASNSFTCRVAFHVDATSGNGCWLCHLETIRDDGAWITGDGQGGDAVQITQAVAATANDVITGEAASLAAWDQVGAATCTVGNCGGHWGKLVITRPSSDCTSDVGSGVDLMLDGAAIGRTVP